ncbi:RloB family protein [Xenophilus azovorans]|uniref:RloB family protein n=1 Tax=Xenophilus azovorans TaxID=151755 RepID=UPI0014708460|nr:RloB family protein [Xenophilus azovorans]
MRRAAPLARHVKSVREPKSQIVVVCEGKVTEPRYFNDFRLLRGSSLVKVKAIGGCGVPVSVVEQAIKEKAQLEKIAKKTGNSFDKAFEVWAVFDRDEHPEPQVPEAFRLATQHRIFVAYSNPCFEVWGLMHFSCWGKPGHHHETQRDLKNLLNGYCHKANPVMDVSVLNDHYDKAVEHAKRARSQRLKESGSPHGDPSTTVDKLTERIRQNGKG